MLWRLIPIAVLGAIVASGAAGLYGYHRGEAAAEARCDAERLAAELAATKREFEAYKTADAAEAELMKDIAATNDRLQKELADYEHELATRPDGKCTLGPDDLRGMPAGDAR